MITDYTPDQADGWLRCRALSFLYTDYYDDVYRSVPTFENAVIRLVDVTDGTVHGLIDVEVFGDGTATIDSIAVHPDHARKGIGSALLGAAVAALPPGTTTLDAWTRDDAAANAWYLRSGFVANYRYLHVHLTPGDPTDGFISAPQLSSPVLAFCHAAIEHEAELRARYQRVHVCRQYLRSLV